MSQPESNDPRTPRSKSSHSSLLSTFKSLTSGKSKSSSALASPAASPSSPSLSPSTGLSNPGSTGHSSSENPSNLQRQSPAASNDGQPLDNSLIASNLLPSGSSQLLECLKSNNSLYARAEAARRLTSILNQYQGGDVPGIWLSAKDLLEQDDNLEVAETGYDLLLACIRHKSLTAVEKQLLLDSLPKDTNTAFFAQRFKVLTEITDYGRSLEGAESFVLPQLLHFLHSCYLAAHDARKATAEAKKAAAEAEKALRESGRSAADINSYLKQKQRATADVENANLVHVFDFIRDLFKHNAQVLAEQDLESLVSQLKQICVQTTSLSDIQKSMTLVDAMAVYSVLPRQSLRLCVEILCGVHASLKDFRSPIWHSFENLLGSHLGPATLNTLVLVLKEKTARGKSFANMARGAVQILRAIYKSNETAFINSINLPKVMSGVRQSLEPDDYGREIDDERLKLEILDFICDISKSDDAVKYLLNSKIWQSLDEIIRRCALPHVRSNADNPDLDIISGDMDHRLPDSKDLHERRALVAVALQSLANRFMVISRDADQEQIQLVMRLMMQVVKLLDDETTGKLVTCYSQEFLIQPSDKNWSNDFHSLLANVVKDFHRSSLIRQQGLVALREACTVGEALGRSEVVGMILKIIECVRMERDGQILEGICQTAVDAATSTKSKETFESVVNYLMVVLFSSATLSRNNSSSSIAELDQEGLSSPTDLSPTGLAVHVTECFVRIFLRSINRTNWKALRLFDCLLSIVKSTNAVVDARIIALKLLFRLRADTKYAIFVSSSTECDDVAAMLCRTEETIEGHDPSQSPVVRPRLTEDHIARRSQVTSPTPTGTLPKSTSTFTRSWNNLARTNRPTPPLWLYPGPKGLPEEPPLLASPVIAVHQALKHHDKDLSTPSNILKMSTWLELLLGILQQEELEWEVFSYILVHLGAQLTNHALFVDATPQIKLLRSVLCSQIANRNFHEPPPFTNLKRADAEVCMYHILTMLVSYHQYFSKNEQDDMVRIFVQGVGGERITEMCIHALSICCHELPMSLTKSLESALRRMTQIITKPQASVHILEFLAGLARLPELFRNLREEDFKMVFGICFRYLEDVRDSRTRAAESSNRTSQIRPATSHRELAALSDPSNTVSEDLPQYLYALSFHVMTFWFMAMKLQDRPKHIDWITKNLTYTDTYGQSVIDEQAQVTIDMMHRVAFSDRDETVPNAEFAAESDGLKTSKSWVIGSSILTIETAGRTGLSQVTRRRPSGTRYSTFTPHITPRPRHQVPITIGLAAETYYTGDYIGLLPDALFQELYAPLSVASPSFGMPQPLPNDEATQRSIELFDLIPALDGHKAGVIYVGEAQDNEITILSNVMGSSDYVYFLKRLGTLTKLKGATVNMQGLDREFNTDGEFTFCWRDRVTELVLHVPTMMPTDLSRDPHCTQKKKHIGNDFVNIIWNNSGKSFSMDTFPSDLNYVNIVITPEARASFVETRLLAAEHCKKHARSSSSALPSSSSSQSTATDFDGLDDPYDTLFYKVTLLTKPNIPSISPASKTKIISGASLPAFVRLLTLNASVFCQVWANRESAGGSGEHVSSWRNRLREINKLRDRFSGRTPGADGGGGSMAPPGSNGGVASGGTRDVTIRERESLAPRRASAAHIFGGGSWSGGGSGGAGVGSRDSAESGPSGGGSGGGVGGKRTSGFSSSTAGTTSTGTGPERSSLSQASSVAHSSTG